MRNPCREVTMRKEKTTSFRNYEADLMAKQLGGTTPLPPINAVFKAFAYKTSKATLNNARQTSREHFFQVTPRQYLQQWNALEYGKKCREKYEQRLAIKEKYYSKLRLMPAKKTYVNLKMAAYNMRLERQKENVAFLVTWLKQMGMDSHECFSFFPTEVSLKYNGAIKLAQLLNVNLPHPNTKVDR